jgi:hypothetical protein
MNPIALSMWRICKIDGRPSRYLNEPHRTHLPTVGSDPASQAAQI